MVSTYQKNLCGTLDKPLCALHTPHMKRIEDLIEAFGGVTKFGRVIGKRTEHVGSMRSRGSIPARYWKSIVDSEKGRELGLTLDDLVRLNFESSQSTEVMQ